MVHHHRIYFHQLKKAESEEEQHKDSLMETHRQWRPTGLRLFFLFSLVYFVIILAPRLLSFAQSELSSPAETAAAAADQCSDVANNTICCDRTAFRTDVCVMRGDVRTQSTANSFLLVLPSSAAATAAEERIRPYTRKWESSVMSTIDELRLRSAASSAECDVRHDVPAVVFSTGGYTGNVYHEFNDGILPLYITSQHFNRRVVFVILEYHDWWITKYSDVLSQLSDVPPIDFSGDRRTHCFPEAIVGLRIHDELAVDPDRTPNNRSILDFHSLLDDAYRPRIREIEVEKKQIEPQSGSEPSGSDKVEIEKKQIKPKSRSSGSWRPKLVIMSRNGSRSITNEAELVTAAEEVGFSVAVLRPKPSMELAKIYRALNGSDMMIGVHGAAMTHFLFMRAGSVFVQVVPLGTEWAADSYYGSPAARMGLRYVRYGVAPRESSLYSEYARDDPVLRDPESVNAKGWEFTKRVYLDGQKVKLDLARFRKRLVRAHRYLLDKRRGKKVKS